MEHPFGGPDKSIIEVRPSGRGGAPLWLVVMLAAALGAVGVGFGTWAMTRSASAAPASAIEMRPTNDVLVAIKDMSRLEVTEVQVEKVIDLADKQSRMFGMIETEDQMLLVAAGSAVIGVDLEKMGPDDSSWDEESRTVKLKLPAPQILTSRLDPDNTYVYKRETGMLAKRNEQLESRARKEAMAAIERTAQNPDAMARAKRQAERQLTALLMQAGAKRVVITWK